MDKIPDLVSLLDNMASVQDKAANPVCIKVMFRDSLLENSRVSLDIGKEWILITFTRGPPPHEELPADWTNGIKLITKIDKNILSTASVYGEPEALSLWQRITNHSPKHTPAPPETGSEDDRLAKLVYDKVRSYANAYGAIPDFTSLSKKNQANNYILSVYGRQLEPHLLDAVREKLSQRQLQTPSVLI